jgi:hypothetical protein
VKGALSQSREKIKDFQFCLPILPMYLPLKFPNGQFPLKIPGPISQATLEQNKKNKKFTRGGVYTWATSRIIREKGYQINQKRFFLVKSQLRHLIFFLSEGDKFFVIGFGFAWLIGPGIFRGNCPFGNFKGRYADRIGRQD